MTRGPIFRKVPHRVNPMSNPFLNIVREATRLKWCTTLHCTTCGATEYRKALRNLGGALGGPLADSLADLDLKEITKLPNWQDAVLIALMELSSSIQVEGILNAWISKSKDDDIDVLDLILFKVIKNLPPNNLLRVQWISRCIKLAIQTKNPSLVESLVLVLKHEFVNNSELFAIASDIARDSKQMQRVLFNACGVKISPESPVRRTL